MAFYLTNLLFPVGGRGEIDEVDVYGTFTVDEARKIGCIPLKLEDTFTRSRSLDPDEEADPDAKIIHK